ncbi:MAG: VOC family protein [Anaerolineae bacterium]|nr:VOC family protein [Anaerolineae bacterium]
MLANATAMTTLPAHDMARAMAFFRDKLGLRPQRETEAGMLYQCGDSWFFLYETQYAGTAQNTAMSFLVEDVDAEVAALKRAGVVFEEYDFPGLKTVNSIADLNGERSAWFKDTEGNILSVSQLST